MDWEPARADHSIDRVTASVNLAERLDPDTFDELIVAVRKTAANHKLTNRLDIQEPFDLAEIPLKISLPPALPRRVVYQRLESSKAIVEEVSIGVQTIAIATLQYHRWQNFFGLVKTILETVWGISSLDQRVKSVRLEYVDRFQSLHPTAGHFEVINQESDLLTSRVRQKLGAFHVHSGWFGFDGGIRQLTNVNIDVTDTSGHGPPNRQRQLAILTMGQFEALDGPLNESTGRLDILHRYLKDTLRDIITQEAAERVGLNNG